MAEDALDPASVTAYREASASSASASTSSSGSRAPAATESHGQDSITVLGFDHVVLRVRNVDASLRFYAQVLGLPVEREEDWRAGRAPFPSVRITPSTVIDLDGRIPPDGTNVQHYCLEIAVTDLAALTRLPDLTVVGGPVRRWGARGEADLIYIADPDGNTIELRHYGPTQGFGYNTDGSGSGHGKA